MSVRTINRVYCFKHPFHLLGRVQSLPAGTYCVETYEELEKGNSFVTYQPVLSLLHINGTSASDDARGSIQVSLEELDLAIMMDELAAEEIALLDGNISEQEQHLLGELRRVSRFGTARSPFSSVIR